MDDLLNPFAALASAAGKVVADAWTAAMLGLWVLALGQLLPTGGEDAAGAAGPPQAPVAAHQGPGPV